jgi:Holliday junction resolvase RusA-like endonuclease
MTTLPSTTAPAAEWISFFVPGEPKGQPRPRAFARRMGSRFVARVYDAGTAEGWKGQIAIAARAHVPATPLCGAMRLSIEFVFPRPRSHFRTGRHAHELRPDAPTLHTGKPDLDNLIKAVKDALTVLRMWEDDCAVCEYGRMRKRYGEAPGAFIRIERVES